MISFSLFNNKVQLSVAVSLASDVFYSGILTSSDGLSRATLLSGDEYSNGMLLTDAGRVMYVDATLGLPVNSVWSNGLPRSDGALCVSLSDFQTYSNGLPFAANGAVAAEITP